MIAAKNKPQPRGNKCNRTQCSTRKGGSSATEFVEEREEEEKEIMFIALLVYQSITLYSSIRTIYVTPGSEVAACSEHASRSIWGLPTVNKGGGSP